MATQKAKPNNPKSAQKRNTTSKMLSIQPPPKTPLPTPKDKTKYSKTQDNSTSTKNDKTPAKTLGKPKTLRASADKPIPLKQKPLSPTYPPAPQR